MITRGTRRTRPDHADRLRKGLARGPRITHCRCPPDTGFLVPGADLDKIVEGETMARPTTKPTAASGSLLTTALDDPRAERARRAAMQSYVEGRITHAQAIERVRKAIERFGPDAA
jgi:hypothetical protein